MNVVNFIGNRTNGRDFTPENYFARKLLKLVCGLILLSFSACAGALHRSGRHSEAQFIHRVHYRGETLASIAGWYTGNSQNWREIAAANPDVEPRSIRVGDRIFIPKSLLIRHDPLPREAATGGGGAPKSKQPGKLPPVLAPDITAKAKGGTLEPLGAVEAAGPEGCPAEEAPSEDLQAEVVRDRLQEALLARQK